MNIQKYQSRSQPVNLNYVKEQWLNPVPGNINGTIIQETDLKKGWKGITQKNKNGEIVRVVRLGNKDEVSLNELNNNFKSYGSGITTGVVPTNSRPQNNLSVSDDYSRPGLTYEEYEGSLLIPPDPRRSVGRYNGLFTTARGVGNRIPLNPLKQWRKQLIPSQGHITGKPQLNDVMDKPSNINIKTVLLDTSCCDTGQLTTFVLKKFQDIKNCNCNSNEDINVIRNARSNFQPVTFNNPERVVRPRSSQTIMKKNYYTTGKAYLRSRVKLYDQNQTLSIINGNTAGDLGFNYPNMPPAGNNYVFPSNELDSGSQAFHSNSCVQGDVVDASGHIIQNAGCCPNNLVQLNSLSNRCQRFVVYKPNNPFYSVQGAVDSSTRILQAKYNAITKNNYDFSQRDPKKIGVGLNVYSIAGNSNSDIITLPGSTPQKYYGDQYRQTAPYFIKNKYQRINACSKNQFNLFNISIHSRARINSIGNRMPSGGKGIINTCFYNL